MTAKNDSHTSANPTRKILVAGLAFAIAAICTIATYKLRASSAHAEGAQEAVAIKVAFDDAQKNDIQKIIRDYLLKNPELLLEVQTALDRKMQAEAEARTKKAISENAATLYKRADAPSAGKADGDITVVEFFDYNCGYCKRGLPDIAKLLKDDPNVRVVFKELPILSKGSEDAARVAIAAKLQGKYWEVHSALLKHRGQSNKESALKIAEKAGLDMTKLNADINGEAVSKEITLVRNLAQKMAINGTPHFLVGDRSIAGAPEDLYDQLKKIIAELRTKGCEVC